MNDLLLLKLICGTGGAGVQEVPEDRRYMSTGVQKGHEYKDYNRSTEGAGVLGVQVYEYRRGKW